MDDTTLLCVHAEPSRLQNSIKLHRYLENLQKRENKENEN